MADKIQEPPRVPKIPKEDSPAHRTPAEPLGMAAGSGGGRLRWRRGFHVARLLAQGHGLAHQA